jgi:glycosyltransferase involved in cell wall biosynthesis
MALIGFDARILYRAVPGGIGTYLQHLTNGLLSASDHRVRLYHHTPDWVTPMPTHERLAGCYVPDHLGHLRWWEQQTLPQLTRRDRVELLHCPFNSLPWRQHCPTIVTIHDTILTQMDDDDSRGNLFYWRNILPPCARRAARILTVSVSSQRDIARFLRVPEERVIPIHHGCDTFFHRLPEAQAAEAGERAGLPSEFIFLIGAGTPHKNVDRAVDAFIGLKRRHFPTTKLVSNVKSAAYRAHLQAKLDAHGLGSEAMLLEYVTPEMMRLLYNRALLFIFPSLIEGFGFPMVEAMACGAPVAAANASCLPEIAGDAAVLFDPFSVEDMASAMGRLLGDASLRQQMRERGHERARQFTWSKTVEKTLAVYEEVLGGG